MWHGQTLQLGGQKMLKKTVVCLIVLGMFTLTGCGSGSGSNATEGGTGRNNNNSQESAIPQEWIDNHVYDNWANGGEKYEYDANYAGLIAYGYETGSTIDATVVFQSFKDAPVKIVGSDYALSMKYLCNVTICEGIEIIQRNAFQDCPKLAWIAIPESVYRIDEDAFNTASDLTLLVLEGSYGEEYAIEQGLTCKYFTWTNEKSGALSFD